MKNRKWLHGLVFAAGLGALGCGSNAATDAGPADVVGEAPVAVADHFTAQRDTLLQVPAASGLLANDHVPSGTTITAPTPTSATTAGGTLMLSADGGFEYTPPPAFTGQDSFSYTITSAAGHDSATVTLLVDALPTAQNDSFAVTAAVLTVADGAGVMANDDAGYPAAAVTSFGAGDLGGTVTTHAAGSTAQFPDGSTLVLRAAGGFVFTPAASFSEVSFSYRITNSDGTSDATVRLAVPHPPMTTDDAFRASSGAPLSGNLLDNDQLGMPAATVTSFGGGNLGGSVTSHAAGTSVPVGSGALGVDAQGHLTFTSDAGFEGTFTFQYRLANADGSSDGTVTISVTTAPVAVNDTFATLADTSVSGNLLANDSSATPMHVVSFGGGSLPADQAAGTTTDGVSVAADGSLAFTPPSGTLGPFSFGYHVENDSGADDAQVTITVNAAPVPAADTITAVAGQTVGGQVLANDSLGYPAATLVGFGGGSLGGSAGDHPPESTVTAQGATLTLHADGTFQLVPGSFIGVFSFNYRLQNAFGMADGQVTINSTVAPTAVDDTIDTSAGMPVQAHLLDNDTLGVPAATLVTFGGGDLGAQVAAGTTITPLPGQVDGSLTIAADGSLQFVPAALESGELHFTYLIQNSGGQSQGHVTVEVYGSVGFTSGDHATFVVGQPGTFAVTTAGTPAPAVTISSANPPAWLALVDHHDGTATLSGAPPAGSSGSYTLQLSAQNTGGAATQQLTLTVNQGPGAGGTTTATFTAGVAGQLQLATSGSPAAVFTNDGAALPSGLLLSPSGLLEGTPATGTGGVYTLTITASNGVPPDATFVVTLTVDEAPRFTNDAKATFGIGVPGEFPLAAAGFPSSFTFSNSGAALPDGLSLDADGVLEGTVAEGSEGVYPLQFTVDNGVDPAAIQDFELTIVAGDDGPPDITSEDHATFQVGIAGSVQITASGPADLDFTDIGDEPPAGLTLKPDGTLAGTPRPGTGGVYHLVIQASGDGQFAQQDLTVTVLDKPAFTSTASATFEIGQGSQSFALAATGYPGTVTFTSNGEALPSGITLSPAGVLSGTPGDGTAGVYHLTFAAANGVNPAASQSFTLTVLAALKITSAGATTFTTSTMGTFTVTTTGTPAPKLTIGGAGLPGGVTFVDNGNGTGTLGGIPNPGTGGVYALTVNASNAGGSAPQQAFTLTVDQPPAITSAPAATFGTGTAGAFTVTVTGYPLPAVTLAGLPGGLSFTDNQNGSGTLGGTAGASTGGVYPLTVVAGAAQQSFTLTVDQPGSLTSAAGATFTVGTSGLFTAIAAGYPVPDISLSGTLPGGVLFTDVGSGTATLSGTPAAGAGGTYALTFSAGNTNQPFTLTVDEAVSFSSATGTSFSAGAPGSFVVTTLGFPRPAISLASGTLPDGVTLVDQGDGTASLAGTAVGGTVGSYPLGFSAGGVSQSFTLTILGCDAAGDCPGDDSECATRTCDGGICGVSYGPSGTMSPTQTSGDCTTRTCDGTGGVFLVNDNDDLPPSDGNICNTPTCSGGAPSYPPVAAGTPLAMQTPGDCEQAQCDGAGGVTGATDDNDVPPPQDCVTWMCSGGFPSSSMATAGTTCSSGYCDDTGACATCYGSLGCSAGQTCSQGACCSPSCAGKTCGLDDDGCGTICGNGSPDDASCQPSCVASCAGEDCYYDEDGCGNTCGEGSPDDANCCNANCVGVTCGVGDDGCGMTCGEGSPDDDDCTFVCVPGTCEHGGTWDMNTCGCDCPGMFGGSQCEYYPCQEPLLDPSTCNGIPSTFCEQTFYQDLCPEKCVCQDHD